MESRRSHPRRKESSSESSIAEGVIRNGWSLEGVILTKGVLSEKEVTAAEEVILTEGVLAVEGVLTV